MTDRAMNRHPLPPKEEDSKGHLSKYYCDRISEVNTMICKARDKLLYEAELNNLKAYIDSNKETDDWLINRIRSLNQETLSLQKQRPAQEFYWLTVSPKPDTTFEELEKKVNKFNKSKMILGTVYTYELREDGTPHCHMIVRPEGVSDSDFRKRAYNPFKDIAPRGVKVQSMPKSWYNDKVRYLLGDKDDPEKFDMVLKDREWRADLGLPNIYYTGCLTPETNLEDDSESDGESP